MKIKISWRTLSMGLLLGVLTLGAAGCATTEADNESSRPWASPKSWQYGVPGMDMMH